MENNGVVSIPLLPVGKTPEADNAPFLATSRTVVQEESRVSVLNLLSTGRLALPSRKAILCYLTATLLLIPHAVLVYKWPKGDYGLGVLEDNFPCGSHGTAFIIFLVDLPLNIIAGLITYAAGFIGTQAFLPLRICLMLLSIPNHLLYNSLLFQSMSARDSYEILVSNEFMHTQAPFDLSTVPLLQTSGKVNPLQQDYQMSLPGIHNLTASLTSLQASVKLNQTQSAWHNISTKDCLGRYQAGTYDTFSNVIVVSNWTSVLNVNNSVLDLTILSGYAGPKHQRLQALVSLCPDSFFSIYSVTEPKEWKFVDSKPNGLCDPYTSTNKTFPITQENVFIQYCLSQEPEKVCRLLYSPLVLKLLFWILVANLSCMTLALFLQSADKNVYEDASEEPETWRIYTAFCVVVVVFTVMLLVMWFSTSAHYGPRDKSDETWLLKAFLVINIVQLFDAICDILNVPWGSAFAYTIFGMIWHWFLAGAFAMQISDRYLITSTSPGFVVVPYADLESLWFEWVFNYLWHVHYVGIVLLLIFGGFPLYLRYGTQKLICEKISFRTPFD